MLWFWLLIALAAALAAADLGGDRARAAFVAGSLAPEPGTPLPPATVIVPVSASGAAEKALRMLRDLDYPAYELLIAARHAAEIPASALPGGVTVVLAGESEPGLAGLLVLAVRAARKDTQILAFTDGKGLCSPGWLRALARPLAGEGVGASTGYRWYTPQPPDFWSLMRSVWHARVAAVFGPRPAPFAWSGAMAIRRETFFAAQIAEAWRDSGSPGRGMTAAMRAAGLTIAFAPGAMVALEGRAGMAEFLRRAASEMQRARREHPKLWAKALLFFSVQCAAMAAALGASLAGSRTAEWALVVQWGLTMLKGANLASLAKAEMPSQKTWFERHGWVHAVWVPLALWVWLGVLISSSGPRNKRI